jgi:hypothetical protein
VNLTGNPRAAEAALEKGAIERAMEHVRDAERAELRGLLVRGGALRFTRQCSRSVLTRASAPCARPLLSPPR